MPTSTGLVTDLVVFGVHGVSHVPGVAGGSGRRLSTNSAKISSGRLSCPANP
jgi:hypothetical protein